MNLSIMNDPEYILMCENDIIQNHFFMRRDDLYVIKGQPEFSYLCIERKLTVQERKDVIWLPRHDQLQEMIDFEYTLYFRNHTKAGYYFSGKLNSNPENKHFISNSSEKVLLMILYKRKYNKQWNGENWIEA